jgi:hypothetical protein
LKRGGKVALVAAGYIAALAAAYTAVALNDATMDPVTRQSGMAAFGDSVLFLAVFSAGSVPITGYLTYAQRGRSALWRMLSFVAVLIAVTTVALLAYLVTGAPAAGA